MLTTMAANSTRRVTDAEVLEFYNLATSKILTGLEVRFNKFSLENYPYYYDMYLK